MPLMLINHAPFSIKIYPYMGIVQLMLIPLNAEVKRDYSDPKLKSKYMDDDGGPSRYWLDNTVDKINDYLKRSPKISSAQMAPVLSFSEELDEETRKRFSKFISRQFTAESSGQLISGFIKSERRRSLVTNLFQFAWPIIIAASLGIPRLYGFNVLHSSVAAALGVLATFALIVIWLRRNWATPKSVGDLLALQKLINK